MLSKIIVSSYAVFIEISLWLSLLLLVIGGWHFLSGFAGAIIGLAIWFVISAVFFGAFLILEDIREIVKRIEEAK